MEKIVVLDAETLDLPEGKWAELEAFGEVELHDFTPREEETIVERCKGAAIVLSNKVPLMKPVLDRLSGLKLICILATGMNNVDLEAAKARGIAVRNVPDYSTKSVTQHCLALLLELTNRVGHYDESVQQGEWIRSRQFCYWNHSIPGLAGRTAGIIGFGEIGRSVADVLHALGMRVIAHTRTEKDPPDWKDFAFVDQETLFSTADVISLHCPLTKSNKGFVNADLLQRCKKDAFLINTARGALINESDLRSALEKGWLAGAGLDVLSEEPMDRKNPLLQAPNCVITPHIAWASLEARETLFAITLENIRSFLEAS